MFETARRDLQHLDVDELTRSGLELLVEQLSSLESAVTARKLDVMATIARTRGKASARKASKSARTAKKLAEMPKTRQKLVDGEISEEHADAAADAAEAVGDPEKADEALARSGGEQPAGRWGR